MSDELPELFQPALLNIAEAAQLWRDVTEDMTPEQYEYKCIAGELQTKGVDVRQGAGGTWLTDMDSLLAFLDRKTTAQMQRVKELLEERSLELGG